MRQDEMFPPTLDEPIAECVHPKARGSDEPRAVEHTGAEVRSEMRRRLTNREEVRELLSDGEWHSNSELHAVGGFRYGARILELRQGVGRVPKVIVHTVNLGEGVFKFQLDASRTVTEGCSGPCCIAREAGEKIP